MGEDRIAQGCVAGIAASWQGRVGGRSVVELNVRWKKPPSSSPTGRFRTARSLADFMVLGHIMTAMPAVNAIPAVVAAPPGIVSCTELPPPVPRGLVRV